MIVDYRFDIHLLIVPEESNDWDWENIREACVEIFGWNYFENELELSDLACQTVLNTLNSEGNTLLVTFPLFLEHSWLISWDSNVGKNWVQREHEAFKKRVDP